MAKAKIEVQPEAIEYYRLSRDKQNMFSVETITVSGDTIISRESTEATFLPISFDVLRRKTGQAFFKAVQDNL